MTPRPVNAKPEAKPPRARGPAMTTGSPPRIVERTTQSTIALMVVAGAAMCGVVNSRGQSAVDLVSPAPRVAAGVLGEMTPSAPARGPISDAGGMTWLIDFARRDPSSLLRLAR
jgi:hypothetical protein